MEHQLVLWPFRLGLDPWTWRLWVQIQIEYFFKFSKNTLSSNEHEILIAYIKPKTLKMSEFFVNLHFFQQYVFREIFYIKCCSLDFFVYFISTKKCTSVKKILATAMY